MTKEEVLETLGTPNFTSVDKYFMFFDHMKYSKPQPGCGYVIYDMEIIDEAWYATINGNKLQIYDGDKKIYKMYLEWQTKVIEEHFLGETI